MTDFLSTYVSQTRQEIDTEKHSRDTILNVVILVLGAVGFAMFQAGNTEALLRHPVALVVETTMLVTITGLFWLRRKKLQQIADRWFVLHNILQYHLKDIPVVETLEAIVEKDLRATRYTRKDLMLCFAVSCPIYGLVAVSLCEHLNQNLLLTIASVLVFATLHFAIAAALMLPPFKCPEPLTTARGRKVAS